MTVGRVLQRAPRRWAGVGIAIVVGVAAVVGVTVFIRTSGEPGEWVDAWIESPSSRTLMVRAVGQSGLANQCGLPQVHLTAEETASEVRVTARYSRLLPGPEYCAYAGNWGFPHPVALAAPLGGRRVVDASTGQARTVLDASAAATIRGLPDGYTTYDLAGSMAGDPSVPIVVRQYRGPGGFVTLQTQTTTREQFHHGGDIVRVGATEVRFSSREDEPRDVYYLEWVLPSGTQATVGLHLAHGTWTRAQALEVLGRTTDRPG